MNIEALIGDYESGVVVQSLCQTYRIGLSRLYRILDENHIPRRSPSQSRIALDVQRMIVADYAADQPIATIASRHGVSTSAVSDIARRYWRHRQPVRQRAELIRLIVAWLLGKPLKADDLDAIMRVGVSTSKQGLATVESIEPALLRDVVQEVIVAMTERWLPHEHSPDL